MHVKEGEGKMKKERNDKRKRKPEIMSNLKKGDLKECPICRFGCKKEGCTLPFPNELEVVEEKKGYCIYFTGRRK